MSPFEAIVVAITGNVALLAVLAFLAKSLLSQLLAKDLQQFESRLSQASTVAAEELKHRLNLVAHEHNVRFSHLHEKQAEVLESIYAKLLDFEDASAAMTLANNDTPENLLDFTLRRAQDAGRELAQYIRRHEIYLPPAVSTQVHDLLERVTFLLRNCSFNLLNKILSNNGNPEHFPETRDAWAAVHRYLEKEAPEVRRALEADFRRRLGTEI